MLPVPDFVNIGLYQSATGTMANLEHQNACRQPESPTTFLGWEIRLR